VCVADLAEVAPELAVLLEAAASEADSVLGGDEGHVLAVALPEVEGLRLLVVADDLELVDALFEYLHLVRCVVVELGAGRLGSAVDCLEDAARADVGDGDCEDGVD